MAELDNELMATSTSISGSQQQQQQQMDFAHALESIHARQTERLAAAPPSAATAATTSTAAAVCSNCGTELSAGLALDACATQAVSHTALSSEGDSADHNNNTTSSPSTSTGSLPPHALERDLRLAAQLGQALLHEKHALEAAMGKTRRANDQLVERLARAVRDNKALQHVSAWACVAYALTLTATLFSFVFTAFGWHEWRAGPGRRLKQVARRSARRLPQDHLTTLNRLGAALDDQLRATNGSKLVARRDA